MQKRIMLEDSRSQIGMSLTFEPLHKDYLNWGQRKVAVVERWPLLGDRSVI